LEPGNTTTPNFIIGINLRSCKDKKSYCHPELAEGLDSVSILIRKGRITAGGLYRNAQGMLCVSSVYALGMLMGE
jgi:hypothetical protein